MTCWRSITVNAQSSGSINKNYPQVYTCVIVDGDRKRRVVGCHIDGNEIILDLEK